MISFILTHFPLHLLSGISWNVFPSAWSISFTIFLMADPLSICYFIHVFILFSFLKDISSGYIIAVSQLSSFSTVKIWLHHLMLLIIATENSAICYIFEGNVFFSNTFKIFLFLLSYSAMLFCHLLICISFSFFFFCLRVKELFKSEDWYLSSVLDSMH